MVIKFEDFQKVDMRSGTILRVERLASPKYTTHKLIVDFGKEVGEKVSGARVVKYDEKDLIGKQMIGVINLEQRRF
jgi:tRNA-binding protein